MQITIVTKNVSIPLEIDAKASLFDFIKMVQTYYPHEQISAYRYESLQFGVDDLSRSLGELLDGEDAKTIFAEDPIGIKNNLSKKTIWQHEKDLIQIKQRLETTKLEHRLLSQPKSYEAQLPFALNEALPQLLTTLQPLISSYVGSSDRYLVIDLVQALALTKFTVEGNFSYIVEEEAVSSEFYYYMALFFNKFFQPVTSKDGHINLVMAVSECSNFRRDSTLESYFMELKAAKASLTKLWPEPSYGYGSCYKSYEFIIHIQSDNRVQAIYAPHAPEKFTAFGELQHVDCSVWQLKKDDLMTELDVIKASVAQCILEKIVRKKWLEMMHPKKTKPIELLESSAAEKMAKESFLSCQDPKFGEQWNDAHTLSDILAGLSTGETKRTLLMMLDKSEEWLSEYPHTLYSEMLKCASLQYQAIKFKKTPLNTADALWVLKEELVEALNRFKFHIEINRDGIVQFDQADVLVKMLQSEVPIHEVIVNFFNSYQSGWAKTKKTTPPFFDATALEQPFENVMQTVVQTIMKQEGLPAELLEKTKAQSIANEKTRPVSIPKNQQPTDNEPQQRSESSCALM